MIEMIPVKSLRDVINLNKIPNDKPGYYKWWACRSEIKRISNELGIYFDDVEPYIEQKDNKYCIYIGIATKESIRKRIEWHINDSHTSTRVKNGTLSTLRQSISSIIAKNQYDKDSTDCFMNELYLEYYTMNLPIKSSVAVQYLRNIEHNCLQNNFYILNIQENHHVCANQSIPRLKYLRKISKLK